jgi:hypothetical protein
MGRLYALRRKEDGAVLLLVGAALVLFLVITALVVNVGNWFTHKRQLQNRADAGAHAAGVEYASKWPACIQDADPAAKAAASAAIIAQARKFAGERTDPTAFNTEVAVQANTNIILNSTAFDVGTDFTDGALGVTADPCYDHPGDSLTPSGGYWTDVRTREDNISRLMASLGLPLSHVGARARIEIHPQISGNKFIPLAVPEQLIVKAQVRYINQCPSSSNYGAVLAQADLWPLKDGSPVGEQSYQPISSTTLWGPKPTGQSDPNPTLDIPPPETDPSGIALTIPAITDDCSSDYLPIGVEVRVAGRKSVNLNQTCAQLVAARFADCWSNISTIRGWRIGSSAHVKQVSITGGNCSQDAYFSRVPNCNGNVSVDVDFGSFPGNYRVVAEGADLVPPAGGGTGVWTSSGTIGVGPALGANDIDISVRWDCNAQLQGCTSLSGPQHRTFVADDTNAGTVDLVRTSGVAISDGGGLQSPLDNIQLTGPVGTQVIFPVIGLRSSIRAGQYRTLRFDNSLISNNQSVDCEPSGGTGHDFVMFYKGCQPYYGPNDFVDGVWWNTSTDKCPDKTTIFAQPNDERNPWQCVPKAPGYSPNVIMDGIQSRLGNCDNIQPNGCQGHKYTCNVTNNYQAWQDGLEDPNRTRVMNLFIVPYGAFKNTGPQDGLPLLAFAAFYVTGVQGEGGADNPCDTDPDGAGPQEADDPSAPGEVKGYFIEWVDNDPGPVDPTKSCVVGQIIPCRASLVR